MEDKSSSPSLPFKSKKTLRSNSKSLLEDQHSLISMTPEKPAELSSRTRNRKVALSIKEARRAARESNRKQPRDRTIERSKSKASVDQSKKLPEKFEILCEFFDNLDSAIRLLRHRRLASNFSNVCSKIETLSDRRFTYDRLAQLKYILPEEIQLKEVREFEKQTNCLKPGLHISFNFGVLDNQVYLETGSHTQCMQLRKLFRTRLSEFVSSHPEIDDVPKAVLPKPFNCRSQGLFPKANSLSSIKTSPATSSTNVAEEMPFSHHAVESQGFRIIKSMVPMIVTGPSKQKEFIGASHFSQSFSRRFSRKVINGEMEKTDQATNHCDQSSSHSDVETNIETKSCNVVSSSKLSSPVKVPSNSTCNSNCLENYASPICSSTLPLPTTTPKVTLTNENDISAKTKDIDSTPAKIVSTPARLMASTPAMALPKRSSMSPDDDDDGLSCSTNKLVRRGCSRSLVFDTPTKEDKNADEIDFTRSASLNDDILDVLPQSLLQSIRDKERKAKEEQMPAITQAKRRQKMIARLPKLFNAIFFLFHSRTIITKEELIYKIIVGSEDIVDKREIEEQLDLLLELVPEWISEKLALSGDVLLCINKLSSVETVRARLEEAK